MFLTRAPVDPSEFIRFAPEGEAGAAVFFFGVVRASSAGREVLYLEYEAYEVLGEALMEELVAQAGARWLLARVEVRHRLGRVGVGETAVLILTASAHREEAYAASRFLIEEIKHRMPIWKKEFFQDGTQAWGNCPSHADVPAGA